MLSVILSNVVMLSVIMLNVVMLSVILLNVVMLSVFMSNIVMMMLWYPTRMGHSTIFHVMGTLIDLAKIRLDHNIFGIKKVCFSLEVNSPSSLFGKFSSWLHRPGGS